MQLSKIKSPFTVKFPGDTSYNPQQRQTPGVLYCLVHPEKFEQTRLLAFNETLSEEIGLGALEDDAPFLAAQNLPENIHPYATAYAGHQFGKWAGQLGDGRAIFAGEVSNAHGETTELQWKGAGATPYSRFADGRAVLRSSLREFLMSEAMHHLGVPTTRALSLSLSGEEVVRDMMYSGNPQAELGAVVVRTAPTFLRFGHFELLAAQGDTLTLKRLVEDTIAKYYPQCFSASSPDYVAYFRSVADNTAKMVVEWLRVGFVHGVMNTDNMSILGLTIDYGPFAMLEEYDLNFTPNTTDLPGRRYAFGKQPQIAQWNLWQLGNALHPLIPESALLEQILEEYNRVFWQYHDEMMARKFGFGQFQSGDEAFFTKAQQLMTDYHLDYTLFFNALEKVWDHLPAEDIVQELCDKCSYTAVTPDMQAALHAFLQDYTQIGAAHRLQPHEAKTCMQATNPKFVLRNYLLYQCIEEMAAGEYTLFHQLWDALQQPYTTLYPDFAVKRPVEYSGVPGCSTLSCSS